MLIIKISKKWELFLNDILYYSDSYLIILISFNFNKVKLNFKYILKLYLLILKMLR
jgi:hypothetical protein